MGLVGEVLVRPAFGVQYGPEAVHIDLPSGRERGRAEKVENEEPLVGALWIVTVSGSLRAGHHLEISE